jgi:serine/threonine-protein kinase
MDRAHTVDRYELVSELASGGMATVYLGRVRGAVGFARTVAIKRLHRHLASDPGFVAMFIDEGRLASRIRHPNVVPTLDIVSDGGELFLVMEYVHGESLSTIARAVAEAGGTIPLPIGAAIVSGMLLGLHAAHEATGEDGGPLDVVHRDVSPQNVLVGADGVARLVDFGVSKAAGRLQSTGDGQVKGKLGYMPPESFRGEVDRRGDVYSTAVVLWELLTGERLFTGSHAEVLAKVLAGQIMAPSSMVRGIPEAFDEVVVCGLEFDPERRFPSARAMERALRRAVPVASAFEVAEWLERTMGSSLRERAERVAAIERGARIALDAPWPPTASVSITVGALGAQAAVEAADATGVATLHTAASRRRPVRGLRRWAWTAPAIAVAALVAGVLLMRSPLGRAGAPGAPALASALPPGTPMLPLTAGPIATPPVSMQSVATPSDGAPQVQEIEPSVSSSAPSPSPAETMAQGAARRGTTPARASAKKSAPSVPFSASGSGRPAKSGADARAAGRCAVPYTVDAQGSTHFIVECVNR